MSKYTDRAKVRQRQYYHECIAKGLCSKCKKPNSNGKTICPTCQVVIKNRDASKILERKTKGICQGCGLNFHNGKHKCKICAAKMAERTLKMKAEVFSHYGNGCVRCYENDIIVLQLDHIDGGGTQHRKELGAQAAGRHFYYKLRKAGYPSGLQILCANCHMKKHAFRMVQVNAG